MQGKTQEAAAAAAGMSVRSARTWQRGPLPLESKSSRAWRTRPDPFAAIWGEAVLPLLQRDPEGALEATTVLEWLEERYPGRFSPAQLRTLQRRLRDWRALQGPEQEVFFPQVHPPGREAQMDFTDAGELRINIAGLPFPHLFFEFILSHSGWRFVDLAFGETFEALQQGLQGALWALGGAPRVVRTDNLSAATHELKETKGRTLTQRYAALLEHYGLQATRTNPRSSHENGVAEQAHYRLKSALAQALIIRGSRDFPSVAAYSAFVQGTHLERFSNVTVGSARHSGYVAMLIPLAGKISGSHDNLDTAEEAARSVLFSASANPNAVSRAQVGLGLVAVLRNDAKTVGNREQAFVHFEDSLAFCRKAGYRPELAWTCYDFADTLLERDDLDDQTKARSLLDEALVITRELSMKPLQERVGTVQERIESLPDQAPAFPDGLSQREVEVLGLVATGRSNRQIAAELVLSVRTIERHVTNIYTKIDARGRAEAATYALSHGLTTST